MFEKRIYSWAYLGLTLLAGGCSKRVSVSSVATPVATKLAQPQAAKPRAEIRSVVFSPDGNLVAVGTLSHNQKVKDWIQIWDAPKKRLLKSWNITAGAANIAFSRDGKLIAIAGKEQVSIWQWPSAKQVRTIRSLGTEPLSCVFGKDSKTLYIGSTNELAAWNSETGKKQEVIGNSPTFVNALSISPDGRILASAHDDIGCSYMLWDLQKHKKLRALSNADSPFEAIFSRDGKWLAGRDYNGTHVWDVTTGRTISRIGQSDKISPTPIMFSPDSKRLICIGTYDSFTQIWDVKSGRFKKASYMEDAFAISPNGKQIVIAPSDDQIEIRDSDLKLF